MKISNISENQPDLIEEGTYLLLINPEKIPHLVFLQDGKYYSLTYRGVELGYSFAPYFGRLVHTKKKLLFFKLELRKYLSAYEVFSRYLTAEQENITCLYPIKELIAPDSTAEMVFQLIPELYDKQMIKSVSHFGMTDLLDEKGNFELSEYSRDDINSYIFDLRKKYVER